MRESVKFNCSVPLQSSIVPKVLNNTWLFKSNMVKQQNRTIAWIWWVVKKPKMALIF